MLAHDVVGEGSRTAIFLHGTLGNRNNWKGFGRRARDRVPGLRCVVADLRGHGQSHAEAPPHTVESCARDVSALCAHLGEVHVVIGHSFGGKVALELARQGTSVADVAALDCPPGVRAIGSGVEDIDRVIAAVRAVPMPIASRKALVEALTGAGLSLGLAQWMTTNLQGEPLTWTFDLDVVEELLASFAQLDLWPFLEQLGPDGAPRVHMVRAGKGARFTDEDERRLRATRAHVHVVANAGHWLHTDDPEGTLAVLEPILRGGA